MQVETGVCIYRIEVISFILIALLFSFFFAQETFYTHIYTCNSTNLLIKIYLISNGIIQIYSQFS